MIVCGGGISGITSALVLQALGWRVAVIAAELPLSSSPECISREMEICWRCWRSSRIATTYAMASAYPHNLRVKNLLKISDDSQTVFNFLFEKNAPGMALYRLYEMFEQEPAEPPLACKRIDFRKFEGPKEEVKRRYGAPCRPDADYLWGWTFKSYFADMPEYVPFLWRLFEERGGVWRLGNVSGESMIRAAAGRPVINCLGVSAGVLSSDSSPAVVVRGCQVVVPDAPMVKDSLGLPLAYNYTPDASIFARASGEPEYVHFFPRSDGWILGQTREPGRLDDHGRWHGAAVPPPYLEIDGIQVPAPIITLNDELLRDWTSDTSLGKRLIARQGYRFYRDPSGSGVRLEGESRTNIIHNYGHGGSGVTVSWGCAIEVGRIMTKEFGSGRDIHSKDSELDTLIARLVDELPDDSRELAVDLPASFESDAESVNRRDSSANTSISLPSAQSKHVNAGPCSDSLLSASINEVIDHILEVHHAYLAAELKRISTLIDEAPSLPNFIEIRAIFQQLKNELEEHAIKEEEVLFPACRKLLNNSQPTVFHCGCIDNPIAALVSEHVTANDALAALRDLTNSYRSSEFKELFDCFRALDLDLARHIHEEDEILFPSVQALESEKRANS